ncbi:unnamed protein product [Chrysoparadoxa australica]
MRCGGPHGSFRYLFTASLDSSIWVWAAPDRDFGHKKLMILDQHPKPITSLFLTPAHLYSTCDGGQVRVWSLSTLELQRVLQCDRRIKCTWVHHSTDGSGKGSLFLGCSDGMVWVFPCGHI